jgi:hypothetical protein
MSRLAADVSLLYLNKTLFERAGLAPNKAPATWADIVKDAQAVGSPAAASTGTSSFSIRSIDSAETVPDGCRHSNLQPCLVGCRPSPRSQVLRAAISGDR